jgi:hypothetical protein
LVCGSWVGEKEVVWFVFHLVSITAVKEQPVLARTNHFVQTDEAFTREK